MCIFFFVSHFGVSFSWKCVSVRPVPYPFAFVADTNRQFIRRMCPQNASIHDKQSVLARAAEENPPSNVIIDFYRLLQSTLLTQIRNRKEPHLMTINYVKQNVATKQQNANWMDEFWMRTLGHERSERVFNLDETIAQSIKNQFSRKHFRSTIYAVLCPFSRIAIHALDWSGKKNTRWLRQRKRMEWKRQKCVSAICKIKTVCVTHNRRRLVTHFKLLFCSFFPFFAALFGTRYTDTNEQRHNDNAIRYISERSGAHNRHRG